MRDLLRRELGRSLRSLPPLDRLQAAWPVACGRAMAARGEPVALEGQTLTILVADAAWRDEMRARCAVLQSELSRIADVPLREIHFTGGLRPAPAAPTAPGKAADPPPAPRKGKPR